MIFTSGGRGTTRDIGYRENLSLKNLKQVLICSHCYLYQHHYKVNTIQ